MGYAIGHNVGLNTLSGGAVRYRAYTALGLGAKQIATIIAFGSVTFLLGAGLLLGLSLVTQAGMSGSVLHVHASLAMLAGGVLLAAVAAYLWLVCTRHEPLRFRRMVIPVPKPRIAFAQIAVACADLLCAACVLYVLLPQQAVISFGAFAGIYLIAIAAGVISNVPGGIGVFEAVLLVLLQSVSKDSLLGALVAYRAIYYFAPFAVALALLGAHELWVHRGPAVRLMRLGRSFLIAVTPQAIAIAVFVAGAVLLFSGATPGLHNRLELLRGFVPLPILELSHLLGSAVGVGSAGDCARSVSAARCRLVADDLSAVRGNIAVSAQGLRLRGGDDPGRGGRHPGIGARPLSAARLVDRAALLRSLDRRTVPGTLHCRVAGDIRLSPRAVRQRAVVGVRVPRLGAAQPSRLAVRGGDRRSLWSVAPAAARAADDVRAARSGHGTRRGADRPCGRFHREPRPARRQELAVQHRAVGLHHVPGVRTQLGGHG